MNKTLVITIVLVVLVVISLVQAIQIGEIKKSIASTGNVVKSNPQSDYDKMMQEHHGGSPTASNDVNNLPDMVGGC